MERSNVNKNLKLSLAVLTLTLMIIVLASALTLLLPNSGTANAADYSTITVTAATTPVTPSNTVNVGGTTYYSVTSAGEFIHMIKTSGCGDSGKTRKFLLMNDFVVEGTGWNSVATTFTAEICGMIYDGATASGSYHTINFSPDDTEDKDGNGNYSSRSAATIGGFFSTFSGKMSNVNFLFSGTMSAVNQNACYGGFAGSFSGTVENCNVALTGSVMVAAGNSNQSGNTIYAGGFAGKFDGSIIGGSVSFGGNVDARTYNNPDDSKGDNNEVKNTMIYAGGIAGYVTTAANMLNGCKVDISGTVSTLDSYSRNSFLGISFESRIGDSYVYPAGGIIGAAGSVGITGCTITLNATMTSQASEDASKYGAITGGVLGLLTGGGTFNFTKNDISFSGGKLLPISFRDDGYSFRGGLIGRVINDRIGGNFQHNIIRFTVGDAYYNTDNNNANNLKAEYRGLFVGSGTVATSANDTSTWNKGNNWLLGIDPSASITFANNSKENSSIGMLHRMYVYGGGEIKSSISSGGIITFTAFQKYSPLYGWFTNMSSRTVVSGTGVAGNPSKSYTPQSTQSSSQSVYAMFLTRNISQSGHLVQFANEMNGGLNFSWVSVSLDADISVELGTPVINEFKGSFVGNGHSITYKTVSTVNGTETAGLFGTIASSAVVSDFTYLFAGTVYAASAEGEVNAGALAGVNNGTVRNVDFTLAKAGSVRVTASKTANVGGFIGKNAGTVTNCAANVQGKVYGTATETSNAGGVIGVSAEAVKSYKVLNVVVEGEVKAITAGTQKVGGLIGTILCPNSNTFQLDHVVVNVAVEGNFKTPALNGSSGTYAFGAFGNMASTNRSLTDCWLIATYVQYLGDDANDAGAKPMPLFYGDTKDSDFGGGNRLYINGGDANCSFDYTLATPKITFTIPTDASKVFTGWFSDYANSALSAIPCQDSILTPNNNTRYQEVFTRVINSTLMTVDDIRVVSTSTNLGQDYKDIEFVLGANIDISAQFYPIGTVAKPFNGIFDGKGHSITVRTAIRSTDGVCGLFGCIGEFGKVFQLTLNIKYGQGDADSVVGGLAAYNYGVIGMDSSANKVIVNIERQLTGHSVGGIVGVNNGMVKNAEVHYTAFSEENRGALFALASSDYEGTDDNGLAGGIVARNMLDGVVKNVISTFEATYKNEGALITDLRGGYIDVDVMGSDIYQDLTGCAYAGGIAALNEGRLYSIVVTTCYDYISSIIGDSDTMTVSAASLIGNNAAMAESDIDSLWLMFNLPDVTQQPDLETYPLIVGEHDTYGNVLVRYGGGYDMDNGTYDGTVTVSIEDNNSTEPYGGSIIFKAVEATTGFYNFISNFENGTVVPSSDGGSGQNLIPTVALKPADVITKVGLRGQVAYAVFVESVITSAADFYAMARNVNNGFSVFVNYIMDIGGSTELKIYTSDPAYALVGANGAVFNGSFNGNGRVIAVNVYANIETVSPETASIPDNSPQVYGGLFGRTSKYAVIQNFTFKVNQGVVLKKGIAVAGTVQALGFVAHENKGTIKNVEAHLYATINGGIRDYVGGLVGYNSGVISNSVVQYNYINYTGVEYVASLYGKNVGGVCGYNDGTIGSDVYDSVKVIVNPGERTSVGQYVSPIFNGLYTIGGVSAVNDGIIKNVNVKLGGIITTAYDQTYDWKFTAREGDGQYIQNDMITAALPDVGGIAGINNNEILGGVVNLNATSTLRLTGNLGGVCGTNNGVIGEQINENLIAVVVSVEISTSVTYPISNYGGVAAINAGSENGGIIGGVNVAQTASVRIASTAGGIVGQNSGKIGYAQFTLDGAATLSAITVGGIAGSNYDLSVALIERSSVALDGYLGDEHTAFAGGVAGVNVSDDGSFKGNINFTLVTVSHDLKGTAKGLITADSAANAGMMTWAYCSNSIATTVCPDESTGFNVLKMVGGQLMQAVLDLTGIAPSIVFTASAPADNWYSDVATHKTLNSATKTTLIPKTTDANCVYHICYYDLVIDNNVEFERMYQYINAYDYFNGVMFKLNNNIAITTTLQPIGTEKYRFTGIFEGNGKVLTFKSGSGIAGTAYSGIFGYLASNSAVRNLIIEVEDGVIIGSGCQSYSGVLAGYCAGKVSNVTVNLRSAPGGAVASAVVGGLAGYIEDKTKISDVWCVVYNEAVKTVGNMTATEKLNVNTLGVLGGGKVKVAWVFENNQNSGKVKIYVDANESGADRYYELFDNWYSDIGKRELISSNAAEYGTVETNVNGNISFVPTLGATGLNATLSFIKLDIGSAEEYYDFVNNINSYGDQKALFYLTQSITVDFSLTTSVGTAEHPFTGIFNGKGNSITIKGDIVQNSSGYSGVFGYVGAEGEVCNLALYASEGQKVGDKNSIYSGFVAARLDGVLSQVVAYFMDDTEIYNVNPEALGGMVGVMSGAAMVNNSWLVLPENYEIESVGSIVGSSVDNCGIFALPNKIKIAGDGSLKVHILTRSTFDDGNDNIYIQFVGDEAQYDGAPSLYGFIDNNAEITENDTAARLDSVKNGTYEAKSWDDNLPHNAEYLVIFLNTTVATYADLKTVAANVNAGRNYAGVVYQQTANIIISDNTYVPIGGQVSQDSTGLSTSLYKIVEFIGSYNGNGYSITVNQDVTIDARYAGIFGVLGTEARIRNLEIIVKGTIGKTVSNYTQSTLHAGALAGQNKGATLKNIIVELTTTSVVKAVINAGRFCGSTSYTESVGGAVSYTGVADAVNCWVLTYNSEFDAKLNDAEALFKTSLGTAISGGVHGVALQGSNNGGVNVVTVVAAGKIRIGFLPNSGYAVQLYNDTAGASVSWQDYYGAAIEEAASGNNTADNFCPATTNVGRIWYASYLRSDINTLQDLISLAEATNEGYDLYGLEFKLKADLVITKSDMFTAIGNENGRFNATFDGEGHTITVDSKTTIEGKFAGIFGFVDVNGTVKNLKIDLRGNLGKTNYSDADILAGKVATLFAGAIAYTIGSTESVIVYGNGVSLDYVATTGTVADDAFDFDVNTVTSGAGGIAIGYDKTNLVTNSWAIISSDSSVRAVGAVTGSIGSSAINQLRVIGPGQIIANYYKEEIAEENAALDLAATPSEKAAISERINRLNSVQNEGGLADYVYNDYYIVLKNNVNLGNGEFIIKGWYSDYENDSQLSNALQIGAFYGDNQRFAISKDVINKNYEVVSLSTIIVGIDQLKSIAKDVNSGGYSYANVTFSLGANITIQAGDAFEAIGTDVSPFRGTLEGKYLGNYYSINLKNGGSLFNYNSGVINELVLVVTKNIEGGLNDAGVIAKVNNGTISGCLVVLAKNMTVSGKYAGGVVAENNGTISDTVIILQNTAAINGTVYAAGIAAVNYGTIEGTSNWNSDWQLKVAEVESFINDDGLVYWNRCTDANPDNPSYESRSLLANVIIAGTVSVVANEFGDVAAGGAVAYTSGVAVVNRLSVRIQKTGVISAVGTRSMAGGMIGRSHAYLNNSVVINEGTVLAEDAPLLSDKQRYNYAGYFVGEITGNAINSWLVVAIPPAVKAVGSGYVSLNELDVSGNGKIYVEIDSSNNIVFSNITAEGGAKLDDWYYGNNIKVNGSNLGNVDTQDGTFKPNTDMTGRTIKVVFINTEISTVEELIDMANSVNSGLSAGSIVFTLNNDLVINETVINSVKTPVWNVTIGSQLEGYDGFKHVFDGNDKTITFNDNSLGFNVYAGLFGFITREGEVKDLTVIYNCKIGNDNEGQIGEIPSYFGGIAAFNSGKIENCKVVIGQKLYATTVGGIAAVSNGKINNCTASVGGYVSGFGSTTDNSYAGGIVGTNAGEVSNVTFEVTSAGTLMAETIGSGTAYAGGIAASNTGKISVTLVTVNGAVKAQARDSAYSGGVIGSNTGRLTNSYTVISAGGTVSTSSSGNVSNYSGGIVGNNVFIVENSVVTIPGSNAVGDSAIGFSSAISVAEYTRNVWVINNDTKLNSTCAAVNNLTVRNGSAVKILGFDGTAYQALPEAAKLKDNVLTKGSVEFFADLSVNTGMTMFADRNKNTSDAVLEHISYKQVAGINYLAFTATSTLKGFSIEAVRTTEIGTASQLNMMAFAFAGGIDYPGSPITYTLTDDIVISGEHNAIGTETMPMPANVIFMGNYKSITIAKTATFKTVSALFGYNAGAISNLIVNLERDIVGEGSAVVAANNVSNGRINNTAVYVKKGINVTNVFSAVNGKNNDVASCWLISTDSSAQPATYNITDNLGQETTGYYYKVMVVNGDGNISIVSNNDEGMTFNAAYNSQNVEFAGFGSNGKLPDIITESLDVMTLTGHLYTAEYLNKVIATYDDLVVLDRLLGMNYNSTEKQFTLGADVTVSEYLAGFNFTNNPFRGSIDGTGHTLTVTDGMNTLFGAMRGQLSNIIIKIAPTNTLTLFGETATATLSNVVVVDERADARLAGSNTGLRLSNTFTVIADSASTVSAGSGTVLTNSKLDLTYGFAANGVTVTATEADVQVFVGWYDNSAAFIDAAKVKLLAGQGYYDLRFVSTLIETEADLVTLRSAVANGLSFSGYTFTLNESIALSTWQSIGTASTSFEGVLNGKNDKRITINGGNEPLFNTLAGTLNGVYVVAANNSYVTANAAVIANKLTGTLNGVVLQESYANRSPVAVTDNKGTINNCWLINTYRKTSSAFNVLYLDSTVTAEPEFGYDEDGELESVKIRITTADDKFNVWTIEDTEYMLDSYDYIDAESDQLKAYLKANQLEKLDVALKAINTISKASEFAYFAVAVAHGFGDSETTVTLGADISITDDTTISSHYVGKFNGNGKRINVSGLTKNKVLFADLDGTVTNLILVAESDEEIIVGIKSGDGAVTNSVMKVNGSIGIYPLTNMQNVWLFTYRQWQAADSAAEWFWKSVANGYMQYTVGAPISVVIDPVSAQPITFKATNNEEKYFAGYKVDGETGYNSNPDYSATLSGISSQVNAYFVTRTIASLTDWNDIANAINVIGMDTALGKTDAAEGMLFYVTADLTIDNMSDITIWGNATKSFKGILEGGYHTVTFNCAYDSSYNLVKTSFDALQHGVVRNLAVAVKTAPLAPIFSAADNEIDNCWVISYVNDISLYVGDARSLILKGDANSGSILSSGTAAFEFTAVPNAANNYDVYEWRNVAADEAINASADGANKVYSPDGEDEFDVSVEFMQRFSVSVNLIGVNMDNESTIPDIKINGISNTQAKVWKNAVESLTVSYSVSESFANGYLFTGFFYTDGTQLSGTDILHGVVNVAGLSGNAIVEARFSLLKLDWLTTEYNATTVPASVDYSDLADDFESELTTVINYEPLGTTPELVSVGGISSPYHVGTYRVLYTIKYHGLIIGNGQSSIEIIPKTLYFKNLFIKNKTYDATTVAAINYQKNLSGYTLVGFVGADSQDDLLLRSGDTDYVQFEFSDKDAGANKHVRVSASSVLAPSAQSTRYTYLDYKLDSSESLRSEGMGAYITATINRRDLVLTASNVTVKYLDQFKPGFNTTIQASWQDSSNPNNILFDVDAEEFNELFSTILGRAEPDNYNVDEYSIIVTNNLAHRNYNIKLTSSTDADASYEIIPSAISVRVSTHSMIFGETAPALNYHIHAEDDVEKACESDGHGGCIYDVEVKYPAAFAQGRLSLAYNFYAITEKDGQTDKTLVTNLADFVPDANYGVLVKYLSANTNFELWNAADLAEEGYYVFDDANNSYYELYSDQAVRTDTMALTTALTVAKRSITVDAGTAANTKEFGSTLESYGGRIVSGNLVGRHIMAVSREAGEYVGSYALIFCVYDGTADGTADVLGIDYGKDVTARYYNVAYVNGSVGYNYSITKTTVTLSVNSSYNTFVYGDVSGMRSMDYVASFNAGITLANICKIASSGNAKSFADLGIAISVGDAGGEIKNVGTYTAALAVTVPDRLANCIGFVLNENKASYRIVQRTINVTLPEVSKDYNGSGALPSGLTFNVGSGDILDRDKPYISLMASDSDYYRVGTSTAATAGSYFYTVNCKLVSADTDDGTKAGNYTIKVKQGIFKINKLTVTIVLKVGYFSNDGMFTAATNNVYYFGDCDVVCYYDIKEASTILSSLGNLSEGATDKEKQTALIELLKIRNETSLYRMTPKTYDASKDNFIRVLNSNIELKDGKITGTFTVDMLTLELADVKAVSKDGAAPVITEYSLTATDGFDDLTELYFGHINPDYVKFEVVEETDEDGNTYAVVKISIRDGSEMVDITNSSIASDFTNYERYNSAMADITVDNVESTFWEKFTTDWKYWAVAAAIGVVIIAGIVLLIVATGNKRKLRAAARRQVLTEEPDEEVEPDEEPTPIPEAVIGCDTEIEDSDLDVTVRSQAEIDAANGADNTEDTDNTEESEDGESADDADDGNN